MNGSEERTTKTGPDDLLNIFLVAAVAVALAIGGVSYLSGSAPEWVALKSSIGLVGVGLIGWLISTVLNASAFERVQDEKKGVSVDVTLPEAAPASVQADDIASTPSATR